MMSFALPPSPFPSMVSAFLGIWASVSPILVEPPPRAGQGEEEHGLKWLQALSLLLKISRGSRFSFWACKHTVPRGDPNWFLFGQMLNARPIIVTIGEVLDWPQEFLWSRGGHCNSPPRTTGRGNRHSSPKGGRSCKWKLASVM